MSLISLFKDIVAPRICFSCKRPGYFLCPECFSDISKYEPYCYVCKKPSPRFSIHTHCQHACSMTSVVVLTHYKQRKIQKLIHDWKFYGRKEIFSELAEPLAKFFTEQYDTFDSQKTLIIPAPMFFLRRWKRWYNQSDILAEGIWKKLGISVAKHIIKKKKYTKQQSHLSQKERISNLKDAFYIPEKHRIHIQGKTIILVDDVISTWTTLNEISKLLVSQWAKNTIGSVIASD